MLRNLIIYPFRNEAFGLFLVRCATVGAVGMLVAIIGVLGWHGAAGFSVISLTAVTWDPANARFGILPMVYGSALVTSLSLVVALPVGVCAAIYTAEIMPSGWRLLVKSTVELLAGIPSIVYGLLGVAIVSVHIGAVFNLPTGRTIATAVIVLSVMLLPTIVTLVDDAICHVPRHYRETAYGLGFTRLETCWYVLLPLARPRIVGATLLALGRALGETMAVMLLIGSIDRLPSPVYNLLAPGQTITAKLGREVAESAYGSLHFSVLIGLGLLLLVLVATITLVARRLVAEERLHE